MRELPPEVGAVFRTAVRRPLLPAGERSTGPRLDRRQIEELIPHRDPFLFIDRITRVDPASATIVCRYDLTHAAPILAGHFPDHPVWPGVLHVEAMGQAGLCLLRLMSEGEAGDTRRREVALTHILGARFIRPVVPGDDVEIVTRVAVDGLFTLLVGQCLQRDTVCSVAVVRGIEKESER